MNAPLNQLTERTVGGFRWTMLPDLQHRLLDENGLRIQQWLASGQARVVKNGPTRIVYRVELPGLSFFIKHNYVQDQRAWFRQMVRQSKARIEFDRVRDAASRGIPTISPLALAEEVTRIGSGESILITQSLDGAIPLHVFLSSVLPTYSEPEATRLRQSVAVELGRLVARIHDAGILHHDLHAGNLLVRIGDAGSVQLFVIDLLAVETGAPLDWEKSRDNLVMINCWFTIRVNRADRLRFWKAYFDARGMGPWERDAFGTKRYANGLHEIETKSWIRNLRFWLRRDKRCLVNNRYYRKVKAPGVVGHALTEVDSAQLAELMRDPDAPFRRDDVRVLKDSISSTVIEMEFLINGKMRPVIFKRFHVSAWKDPVASLFRPTPALRSWIHGQGFRERGLATARPFAVLHRTRLGMWHQGYLLTEKIDHAYDLHDFTSSISPLPPEAQTKMRHELIERVARCIRELHRRQLSHRDLKAANILVRKWDAPEDESSSYSQDVENLLFVPEGTVWLIDLVGVERFDRLSRKRRVQNLARLNASFHGNEKISRADRLRFLMRYLNYGAYAAGDWKSWWSEIEQATQKKVKRNLRRGKPLL